MNIKSISFCKNPSIYNVLSFLLCRAALLLVLWLKKKQTSIGAFDVCTHWHFWGELLQLQVQNIRSNKKTQGTDPYVVPWGLLSLAGLPSSFHLSESPYTCFIYNVRVLAVFSSRNREKHANPSILRSKSLILHFKVNQYY